MSEHSDFEATAPSQPSFDIDITPGGGAAGGGPPGPPGAPPPVAPLRQVEGPAWAGTQPGLRAEPVPIAYEPAPAPAAAPPPPAPAPPPEPVDPEDMAATTLHQRMHPVAIGTPIAELPPPPAPRSGGRAPLPPGATPAPPISDRLLQVGLVVVVGLILLLVLGLVVGVVVELAGDPAEMGEVESR